MKLGIVRPFFSFPARSARNQSRSRESAHEYLPQRELAQGVFARGRPPVFASEEGSERGAAEPSPREARRALRGSAVPLSEPASLARSRTGLAPPALKRGPLGERADGVEARSPTSTAPPRTPDS